MYGEFKYIWRIKMTNYNARLNVPGVIPVKVVRLSLTRGTVPQPSKWAANDWISNGTTHGKITQNCSPPCSQKMGIILHQQWLLFYYQIPVKKRLIQIKS